MSAGTLPIVDIVMVTYGQRKLVNDSLSSLLPNGEGPEFSVTVVDNNSPDDTADMIEREFPWVELVRRTDNPGFAVSNNVAIRQGAAPFILLLNPDTRVNPQDILGLTEIMDRDPQVGMIGCRLIKEDGSFDHASKRNIPSPRDAILYFAKKLRGGRGGSYTADELDETGTGPVQAINGAFMLVRRQAADEVGLLDERYWMYGEDLDWCVRFSKCGWTVWYEGKTTAVHLKGGSSGGRRKLKLNYHFHRSMAVFYKEHLARNVLLDAIVIGGIYVRFVLIQVRNWFT